MGCFSHACSQWCGVKSMHSRPELLILYLEHLLKSHTTVLYFLSWINLSYPFKVGLGSVDSWFSIFLSLGLVHNIMTVTVMIPKCMKVQNLTKWGNISAKLCWSPEIGKDWFRLKTTEINSYNIKFEIIFASLFPQFTPKSLWQCMPLQPAAACIT